MTKYRDRLKSSQIVIVYTGLTFLVFTLAFLLLRFPSQAGDGVKQGLNLCVKTIIPSLFPFMVLSGFFAESGLCSKIGRLFEKTAFFMFRQPGVSSTVILLSNIGGLPVGAKMIKQLYESGQLTRDQGQRLMMFCINPGPAFVISSVGHYMLGSTKAGVIIFISLIASSLLLGIMTRFIANEGEIEKSADMSGASEGIAQSFVNAASQSTSSIIAVCGWVVIFSTITALIDIFNVSDGVRTFLCCMLEVTNGCGAASGKVPIPIIAGIIGWSGICAHFQVMSSVIKLKMRLKYFMAGRIINGALSVVICQALLYLFPVEQSAAALYEQNIQPGISTYFSVTVCIFFMCVILLLGDNFRLKRSRKQKNAVEISRPL